jgi:hypothetical protein
MVGAGGAVCYEKAKGEQVGMSSCYAGAESSLSATLTNKICFRGASGKTGTPKSCAPCRPNAGFGNLCCRLRVLEHKIL